MLKVALLALLVAVVSCQPRGRGDDWERGPSKGGVRAEVKKQGGKLNIRRDSGDDDDEGVEMDLMDIREVDEEGKPVGSDMRPHRNFSSLEFEVEKKGEITYKDLQFNSTEMTVSLQDGTAMLKVQVLNALEDGEISIGDELQAISTGDVKVNILLNNWTFCDGAPDPENCNSKTGRAILVRMRVKGKGKAKGPMKLRGDHDSMRNKTGMNPRPARGPKQPGMKPGDGEGEGRPGPMPGPRPTGDSRHGHMPNPRPTGDSRPSHMPDPSPTGDSRPSHMPNPRPTGDSRPSHMPGIDIRKSLGGKPWTRLIPNNLEGRKNKALPNIYGFGDDDDAAVSFSTVHEVDGEAVEMDEEYPKMDENPDGAVMTLKFHRFNRTIFYDPTVLLNTEEGSGGEGTTYGGGDTTTDAACSRLPTLEVLAILLAALFFF